MSVNADGWTGLLLDGGAAVTKSAPIVITTQRSSIFRESWKQKGGKIVTISLFGAVRWLFEG